MLEKEYLVKLEDLIIRLQDFNWYYQLLDYYIKKDRKFVEEWVEKIKIFKKDMTHDPKNYNRVWEALYSKEYFDELEFILILFPNEEKFTKLLTLYLNRDTSKYYQLLKKWNGSLSEKQYKEMEESLSQQNSFEKWEALLDRFPTKEHYLYFLDSIVNQQTYSENLATLLDKSVQKFFEFLLENSDEQTILDMVKSRDKLGDKTNEFSNLAIFE